MIYIAMLILAFLPTVTIPMSHTPLTYKQRVEIARLHQKHGILASDQIEDKWGMIREGFMRDEQWCRLYPVPVREYWEKLP